MRRAIISFSFLATFAVAPSYAATTCSPQYPGVNSSVGDQTIGFTIGSGFPTSPSSALSSAITSWSSGCPGVGSTIPSLQGSACSGTGCVNVDIVYQPGNSTSATGGCGLFTPTINSSFQIIGGTMTLYEKTSVASGSMICSGDYNFTVAHEIGHALGLGDPSSSLTSPGGTCWNRIMGNHYFGTAVPAVRVDDCNTADDMNVTPIDQQNAENDQMCMMTCGSPCVGGQCPANNLSPILVDLDRNNFHLTSVAEGVVFDLNADGHPHLTSWTDAAGADAFICLDRNHNGRIDSGAELFGNRTPLSTGEIATNGYEALKEFDSPLLGGNGNGEIDPGDAVWSQLRLWVDSNHDGISQSDELTTLDAEDIQSISLTYETSARTDQFGNFFRFRSTASRGKAHPIRLLTTDVFFRQP